MSRRAERRRGRAGGGLSRAQRLALGAEVLATDARVRWLLGRRDLGRVVAELRGRRPTGGPLRPRPRPGPVDPWRYSEAVLRVLRHLPTDARCLTRSLVVLAVLARRRTEVELVIGVRPGPGFAAHAWLERDGVPVLAPGAAGRGRLVEL